MTYSPRCRMKFKMISGKEIADVSDDLISLTTNKGYGRPAGTWQVILPYKVVLPHGKRYDELIRPDDFVTIEMKTEEDWIPVMIGLVDRVGTTRPGGATPQRRVKISGQDLGKLLLVHDVGWDIQAEKIRISKQPTEAKEKKEVKEMQSLNRLYKPDLQIGTPGQLVRKLLGYTFLNSKIMDVNIRRKFNIVEEEKDNWHTLQAQMNSLSGMNLWSAISRVANIPFNILHTETIDLDNFRITHERQPIKDGKINRDISTILKDEEIISDDIGISDHERVNYLFMNNPLYTIAADQKMDVLMVSPDLIHIEEEEIKKHGLQLKQIDTIFYPPERTDLNDPETKEEFSAIRQRRDIFWSWHKDNHKLESGTFQVRLRPDIKAGNGIYVIQPDGKTKKEFLVEQVAHQLNWHPMPQFYTTLHVTRGQKA